jgi:lysosomal Pro-X carboxypeptidase
VHDVHNVHDVHDVQVLADYAVLLLHIKGTVPGAADCPVVAFGGSYGGTLTTYFRQRYPSSFACSRLASDKCSVTRGRNSCRQL